MPSLPRCGSLVVVTLNLPLACVVRIRVLNGCSSNLLYSNLGLLNIAKTVLTNRILYSQNQQESQSYFYREQI